MYTLWRGCTGYVEVLAEFSGINFFIIFIGCTGHVEAVGGLWGPPFFVIYVRFTGHVEVERKYPHQCFSSYIYDVEAMWRL
jgi:hypothetical protein